MESISKLLCLLNLWCASGTCISNNRKLVYLVSGLCPTLNHQPVQVKHWQMPAISSCNLQQDDYSKKINKYKEYRWRKRCFDGQMLSFFQGFQSAFKETESYKQKQHCFRVQQECHISFLNQKYQTSVRFLTNPKSIMYKKF